MPKISVKNYELYQLWRALGTYLHDSYTYSQVEANEAEAIVKKYFKVIKTGAPSESR